MSATDTAELDDLLEFVKTARGFDFTGYKRASLGRRLAKRMAEVDIEGFAAYQGFLEVHPAEFDALFDTILVNVTRFFRDEDAWDFVEREAIPRILDARGADEEIRVWSAGCASGEEAYTIAMLLVRALGEEEFRRRVKIYGTDVDEDALRFARAATWAQKALEPVPEDLRASCFEETAGGFAFHKELRRSLIFGRNDLVGDAPISRVDALTCRNTLMYLNAETQSRILRRLNYALQPTGFLFLGKSEMLLTQGALFRPLSMRCRVFEKVVRTDAEAEVLAFESGGGAPHDSDMAARAAALESAPVAQIVVDRTGTLVTANERARALLAIASEDTGRPLRDLEISYRPADLRSALQEVYGARRPVSVGSFPWEGYGHGPHRLDIHVVPLLDAGGAAIGASVAFEDVTEQAALNDELTRTQRELEAAYEELQSTVEELETTNEELQSTNEELETTNEQLETMNEEFQSTNEELETINEELRTRGARLNDANDFLEAVLASLGSGVAVLDDQAVVQVWNAHAEDLWGVRSGEAAGEAFLRLDIGLPVADVQAALRDALRGETPAPLVLDATDRRGRAMRCVVRCAPLGRDGAASGAVVLMDAESPA